MSPYTPLPQASTPHQKRNDDEDLQNSFQSNPANSELAVSDETTTDRTYLAPPSKPKHISERSLLDPEEFRRLSISTISSMGRQSRGVSPFPRPSENAGPFKVSPKIGDFWQRNKGLFLVSFSQLFGALMNVTTRLLELEGEGMHPFQILFARQGLTMILCSLWMWWKSVPGFPFGAREVRMLLIARSISGFFGIYGMYYSLQYLPVADAVVLTFLAPSVASYGCYLFLKEPFPRSAQYASLISLLGVVLIARPTSFLSSSRDPTGGSTPSHASSNTTNFNNTANATNPAGAPDHTSFPTATSSQRLSAVGVAMIGVLGAAGAFTTIRWIGKRAHPLISVNYFSTFCTLISTLVLTTAQPLHLSSTLQFRLPANLRQWSMLVFLGICGFTMQFLLTAGLAVGGKGGGARATNMIYTNMLFALALDKLIFGQSPGWWSLAGSGLILGSAVFVAVQRQNGGAAGLEDEEIAGAHGVLSSRDRGTEEEEMGMLNGDGMQENWFEDERQGDAVGLRELPPSRAV